MRYIVYIDRLYLLQTIQTMVLLLLTGAFLQGRMISDKKTILRMALGSGAEALFFCALFLVPGIGGAWKSGLLAGSSLILPILVFRLKRKEQILRGIILYHGSAFLLGGIFYAWLGVTGRTLAVHTMPAAACTALTAVAVLALWRWARGEKTLVTVEILEGDVRIVTCALIDSGNTLYDPISEKPVSVVERSVLDGRIALMQPERFRLIPYHTLGSRGLMQMIQLEKLIVHSAGKDVEIEKPLLGLFDGTVTQSGDYRMILNPSLWR